MYSISAVMEQRQCFQDTFKYSLCWHSFVIGRDIKQQCFPGEAKNIFINESSETRQLLGLYSVFYWLKTWSYLTILHIINAMIWGHRLQLFCICRLSLELCVFVSAHYNKICDIPSPKDLCPAHQICPKVKSCQILSCPKMALMQYGFKFGN